MRKLSLDRVYGCSTSHRHSLIGLPQNRVAFIAGCYLVIFDCSTNEQRYLSFCAIEFLYISPRGRIMAVIDRLINNGDRRIHLYSTQPVDVVSIVEPDRFGSFVSLTINADETLLMILHDEPAYMLTIQQLHEEMHEQLTLTMSDLASVRLVHGPVINRMTKEEVTPRVAFISFSPYSSTLFCATGSAIFKVFQIEQQMLQQQIVHFRTEFYTFTCHCWLDSNSIIVATDNGHVFWIHDGSIRSDISLEESISDDLARLQSSTTSMNKNSREDDEPVGKESRTDTSIQPQRNEHLSHLNLSPKSKTSSESPVIYLDLFASKVIQPHFLVAFQEYLLVLTPMETEPFFQTIGQYHLAKTQEYHNDLEIHHIHKMSCRFEGHRSLVYVLTDRNQIYRYALHFNHSNIDFDEQHLYGFHGQDIPSIGLCAYKPWLITLGADHWIRIIHYKDHHREIITKYLPDGGHVVSDLDPYGLHLCVAMKNRLQLYLIVNYELRLIHQYETRHIRNLVISQGGHLIAIVSNNLIKIYSIVTFQLMSQLRGHVGKIQQAIWSKNDSILTSCGSDGMIYTFNTLTGVREGEIITKQFRYVGIAVTGDGQRIYAIGSDSTIKVFSNSTLEQEWPIESDYLPSAILLSKSERLLYIGMTHGIIRIYSIPFHTDSYIDLLAHSSSIRQLAVSDDDQYLVSIGESAYILLFRQSEDLLPSMTSDYEVSRTALNQLDIDTAQKPVRTTKTFDYILVTRAEFDEQNRKIKEIQARIDEVETENNLKLRSKQLEFSQELNQYSNQFEQTMKELHQTYDRLKSEMKQNQCQFLDDQQDLHDQYRRLENATEVIHEQKMIEALSRIERIRIDLEKLKIDGKQKIVEIKEQQETEEKEIIDRLNSTLEETWRTAHRDHENLQEKERRINETIRQNEFDADDQIEWTRNSYGEELKFYTDKAQQLTINVNTLRKHYNSIVHRMESRDVQRRQIEDQLKNLRQRHEEFAEKLDQYRSIIQKKEDRIGAHDMKIHRLQQQILQLEKRNYVLDFKTKSLLERIEPIDQEIVRVKTNNENLEQQLTFLKRQENESIERKKEFQFKLEQSSEQLSRAKKTHQSLRHFVKQQKDQIQKAFELTEISCVSDPSREEKLKKILQEISQSIDNEQQTENQAEIDGFLKDWHRQRHWLVNQLQTLTKDTEENKQILVQGHRDHRKALAPHINQLRDLNRHCDELQKKIDKRLSILKIKGSDQAEFLHRISIVLHGNDHRHLMIDKLRRNELFIELRSREIQRFISIIFGIDEIEKSEEDEEKKCRVENK